MANQGLRLGPCLLSYKRHNDYNNHNDHGTQSTDQPPRHRASSASGSHPRSLQTGPNRLGKSVGKGRTSRTMKTIILLTLATNWAFSATPHVTATWGGTQVKLIEIKTGKTWHESYDDFFKKCGKHKPSEVGVKVLGRLPSWYKGLGSVPPQSAPSKAVVESKAKSQPKKEPSRRGLSDSGLALPVHPSQPAPVEQGGEGFLLLPALQQKAATLLDAVKYMVNGEAPDPASWGEQKEIAVEEVTLPPNLPSLPESGEPALETPVTMGRVVSVIDGVKVHSLLEEEPKQESQESAITDQTKPVRISGSYNFRKPAVITSYALDAVLGGELAGLGEVIVEEARKNKICPLFLAGVGVHESGNGTSRICRVQKNAFGLYDSKNKKFFSYGSVRESVAVAASKLGGSTYKKCKTIREVHAVYCPIGAANDPKNLNPVWTDRVVGHMRRFLGSVVYVAGL